MNVTLCKFCDYSTLVQGGKGAIIGMFDTIHSTTFPFTQGPFHLCVELEFEAIESGEASSVAMLLMDEDGKQMFRFEGEINVPRQPEGRPTRLFQDFLVENFSFPAAGTYRLDVVHNGKVVAEERLYLVQR